MVPKDMANCNITFDSIKPKVLTENLKELEDLGIIQRTSYEGNTLHVEYYHTHLGETLSLFSRINNGGVNYSQERKAIPQT